MGNNFLTKARELLAAIEKVSRIFEALNYSYREEYEVRMDTKGV